MERMRSDRENCRIEEESLLRESYWLCSIPGIGAKSIYRLVEQAGSPMQVKNLSYGQAEQLLGRKRALSLEKAKESKSRSDSFKYLENIRERGIGVLPLWHPDYPQRLRSIPDAPVLLYVKGQLPKLTQKQVAVIGARACSSYGVRAAGYFAAGLAKAGVGIVSGMARGIDGIAQQTALENGGNSIAVLGCGVDICYPPENRLLYERLAKEGCLLSEYPPGTEPKASLFPPRNRIISGLSDLLLVIEAREKSGTLITVDMALEQGREVYAVPGRMLDTCSRGCNRLIQSGAGMALGCNDLLTVLGVGTENSRTDRTALSEQGGPTEQGAEQETAVRKNEGPAAAGPFGDRLRPWRAVILPILEQDSYSLDELYRKLAANLQEAAAIPSLPELMQELLLLCMRGTVQEAGGRYYAAGMRQP